MNKLVGYRTYLSYGAQILLGLGAVLTVLVTSFGGMSLENGVSIAGILGLAAQLANGLGGIFQRLATKSLGEALAELPDDVTQVLAWVKALKEATKPKLPEVPPRPPASTPLIAFMLCLGMGGVAMAEAPSAIINGPRTAEPGEEIILDLSQSEGMPTLFKWSIYPKLEGRKQLTLIEGGKKVRVASFPGTYIVRGMVANAEGISDHEHQITIPGTIPCPPAPEPKPITPTPVPIVPTPGPTPIIPPAPPTPPMPPVPDVLPVGEFDGLPAAVRALALKVQTTNRPAEALALANALEAISAQLAAGTLTDPSLIVSAIGDAFNTSVPASWDGEFRAPAVAKIKALYQASKLNTPARWSVMLREVVAGLKSIK